MKDNIKKVFEMLGVEPNERFKLKRSSCIYYIKENLDIVNDAPPADCFFNFQSLLNGSSKIIKIPKEPTFEELMNWKFEVGEKYYFLSKYGKICSLTYTEYEGKRYFHKENKVYPFLEMVERQREIKEKYHELGHNFTIAEWQDKSITKYTLVINHRRKTVVGDWSLNYQSSKYTFMTTKDRTNFIRVLGETEQEQYEQACLYL